MADEQTKMVAATRTSVEALGIPDSIVRRMLFELAEVIGGHGDHDLALVSAAYRALTNVLQERAQDDKKTPLQIQADAQRAVREIREMGGVVPDVVFTDADFDLPPTTPGELAVQLGYSDGAARYDACFAPGFPSMRRMRDGSTD
ncbi:MULTISPECIES: hypothetical protein [unclassified Microbacterium]|uniref:hypothetical protein n=1 Tax=unclassified Microbacterium TaxID=2609290 RepID=UPI0021A29C48|nr:MULTISPECIES: hypothetical protein [unclassified Microbacterium]MCT1364077.1 hypothetical protein [Microbacterium sp. p3-SID131]MCT1375281.1 hypothetical protein [Microbacterium sp. p3-SID337]